jgi:hypothetical protein
MQIKIIKQANYKKATKNLEGTNLNIDLNIKKLPNLNLDTGFHHQIVKLWLA